jgi:hypothetical protein
MMKGFKQNWSSTLQVAIGSFSLAFVLGLLSIGLWSFLGGLLWTVVGAVGLGSVLLTRFGTRTYVSATLSTESSVPEVLPEESDEDGGENLTTDEEEAQQDADPA